jgi:hypothetical protein
MRDNEETTNKNSRMGFSKLTANNTLRWAPVVIIFIIACCLSFFGGVAYQKGRNRSVGATAQQVPLNQNGNGNSPGLGRRNGRRAPIGTVTAISDSSITVQNMRTGTSQTYTIGSDTKVTNNGQDAKASDIKTGDMVLITPSTTDAAHAAQITINPQTPFGGGSNANPSNQPTSNSST